MKTAVVTGGGSGIGQAVANRLRADGYHVATLDLIASDDKFAHTADVTDRTLVLIRVLDAPREQVFRAWTDPGRVAQELVVYRKRPGGQSPSRLQYQRPIVARTGQGSSMPSTAGHFFVTSCRLHLAVAGKPS